MPRIRRMRLFQLSFLVLFILILVLSVFSSIVLGARDIGLYLLICSFVIALFVAVFGSLSIREEEEELS